MSENRAQESARIALRERLGAGARYDFPAAPARELDWARRGTAYFARKLNEMKDGDLARPALIPGWSRGHVVAYISYHARHLARLAEAARQGWMAETISEPDQVNEDLDFGATLPVHALRYLFAHSAIHLNVEWRDLSEADWLRTVETLDGKPVATNKTPLLRAREIWQRAVDLGTDGSFKDFPPEMLDHLYDVIIAEWKCTGSVPDMVLSATDRVGRIETGEGPVVEGSMADLVRWLSGRGARRITVSGGQLPVLPQQPQT